MWPEVDLAGLYQPAVPVRIAPAANAKPQVGGAVRVLGWSVYETSGANPATVVLYNTPDTSGLAVCTIQLAANESARDWFGPQGIRLSVALTAVVTAGTADGTVFVLPRNMEGW